MPGNRKGRRDKWAKSVEEKTGKTYYYNIKTLKAAWVLPEGALLTEDSENAPKPKEVKPVSIKDSML